MCILFPFTAAYTNDDLCQKLETIFSKGAEQLKGQNLEKVGYILLVESIIEHVCKHWNNIHISGSSYITQIISKYIFSNLDGYT